MTKLFKILIIPFSLIVFISADSVTSATDYNKRDDNIIVEEDTKPEPEVNPAIEKETEITEQRTKKSIFTPPEEVKLVPEKEVSILAYRISKDYLLNESVDKEDIEVVEESKKIEAQEKEEMKIPYEEVFNSPELLKRVEPLISEDVIIEKKEEKSEVEKVESDDINKIEKEKIVEEKSKSEMIIFDNEEILPGLRILKTDKEYYRTRYESEGFIPLTRDEFYNAVPEFKYVDDIVQSSKFSIEFSLGKKLLSEAISLYTTNENEQSLAIFEKLIYYNYSIEESLKYIGFIKFRKADYFGCKNIFSFLITSYKSSSALYLYHEMLGNLYYEMSNFDLSIESFLVSLEKGNISVELYNKIGLAYFKNNDFDNALKYWNIGITKGDFGSMENYRWLSDKLKLN